MKIKIGYSKTYPIQSPMGRAVAGIFLVIGLLICLLGGYRLWSYHQIEDRLVSVDAVIEDIDVRGRGDDRKHIVYVSYTFEGTRYEDIRLSWYSSSMDEGEILSLKLDPSNPTKPVSKDGWLFLLIGGVFTAVGGVLSVAARGSRKREQDPFGL